MATDLPYGYSHDLWRLTGDPVPMDHQESFAHATLLAEYRLRIPEGLMPG